MSYPTPESPRSERSEQLSIAGLLVAGVAQIVSTGLISLQLGFDLVSPRWVVDLTMTVTFAGILVALGGLTYKLGQNSSKLVYVSSWIIAFATGGLLGTVVREFSLGIVRPSKLFLLFPLVLAFSMPICFLVIGVASLRDEPPSSTVGQLLLGAAIMQLVTVTGIVLERPALVIGGAGLFGVTLLVLGYWLKYKASTAHLSISSTAPPGP